MRGPHRRVAGMLLAGGITPAHAGTTNHGCLLVKHLRDHPRSRGDHRRDTRARTASRGSPPLTRGPPHGREPPPLSHGITPAHAGTTPSRCYPAPHIRDHPRSRGDHDGTEIGDQPSTGSPPLTRGPLRRHGVDEGVAGITPAHAGTTLMR